MSVALKTIQDIARIKSGFSFSISVGRYAGFWLHFHRTPIIGPKVHLALGWVGVAVWNRDIEQDLMRPLIEFVIQAVEKECN